LPEAFPGDIFYLHARLLERATRWERRSCGHGAKGERFYDWAFFTVTLPDESAADGFTHTLMIRRSIADPTEVAYFLAHAPAATATNTMVAVAGIRWRIEKRHRWCRSSRDRLSWCSSLGGYVRVGPAPAGVVAGRAVA